MNYYEYNDDGIFRSSELIFFIDFSYLSELFEENVSDGYIWENWTFKRVFHCEWIKREFISFTSLIASLIINIKKQTHTSINNLCFFFIVSSKNELFENQITLIDFDIQRTQMFRNE